MKKVLVLICAILVLMAIPVQVLATTGYVASKESDVYHRSDCYYAEKIKTKNKVEFKTQQKAEAAGYRPCQKCNPDQPQKPKETQSSTRVTQSQVVETENKDKTKGENVSMGFWENAGLFVLALAIGWVASMAMTQLGCILFSTVPILKMLKPYDYLYNMKKLRMVYVVSSVINGLVLTGSVGLIVAFSPTIMQIGFFLPLGLTLIFGFGSWGLNENNIVDVMKMAMKFVKPGMESLALDALKEIFGING